MGSDGLRLEPIAGKNIGTIGCAVPDRIKSLWAGVGEIAFAEILASAKIDQISSGVRMIFNL